MTVATTAPKPRHMMVGAHRYGRIHTFDQWTAQREAEVRIERTCAAGAYHTHGPHHAAVTR